MSLINQMLRDLEERRKPEKRQLPSGEGPAASIAKTSSRRPVYIVAVGIVLIGLTWSGLDFAGRLIPKPSASSKLVSTTNPEPLAVVEPKQEKAVVAVKGKAQITTNATATVEAEEAPASEAIADALVDEKTDTQPAGSVATLLNLGVLETVVSTRLLLEFELLPDYSWSFQGEGENQISFRLQHSEAPAKIKIPQLEKMLLTKLQIASTEQREINLLIEAKQPVRLQTFELPADPFHGQRLLIEVFRDQQAEVPAAKGETEAEVVAVEITKNGETEKTASPVRRMTKQATVQTPAEQAAEAYRDGLQSLQSDDYLAARKQFATALNLQPLMLDARLQLVALAQKLGRSEEAEDYLLQGLNLHPGNADLRKNYARRLMDEGDLRRAIDILQSAPRPEFSTDLEYYALLAALQQEAGQHQSASGSYRQLLNYRPRQALWWLGLAISSEQTGDTFTAKEAYQKALALPGLRADLQDYVSNRLQAL